MSTDKADAREAWINRADELAGDVALLTVPVKPTPAISDAARRGFQDADFCYLRPKPSIHDVRRMLLIFYRTAAAWEGK